MQILVIINDMGEGSPLTKQDLIHGLPSHPLYSKERFQQVQITEDH